MSGVPSSAQLSALVALSGLFEPVRMLLNAYSRSSTVITAWELTDPTSMPAATIPPALGPIDSSWRRYSVQRQYSCSAMVSLHLGHRRQATGYGLQACHVGTARVRWPDLVIVGGGVCATTNVGTPGTPEA